jgi:hypothetical protein
VFGMSYGDTTPGRWGPSALASGTRAAHRGHVARGSDARPHSDRPLGMRVTRAAGPTAPRGDIEETLLRTGLQTHLSDINAQAIGSRTLASTVALAGAGDEAAFAELVAAYHVDMARVALVIGGDRELAEDAVQSA